MSQQIVYEKNMFQQSENLNAVKGVTHGFFGKTGGVSSGIYESLNCGPASLDNFDNVIENRWRAIHSLGLQETKLFGLSQIHSTNVHTITPSSSDDFHQGDALVTKVKGYALSVLGADCAPVLFADPSAGVIAAAHSGWKGAVSGIIEAVVTAMCEQGARREQIQACIGPTIHQDSYEVKQDFIQKLQQSQQGNEVDTDHFIANKAGKYYFDLPAFILKQCDISGIQAESLGIDTYTNDQAYFSFRRNTHAQQTEYGRQISIIALT